MIDEYDKNYFLLLEFERLMGLPDGWTAFGCDGKPISDSQRYKAIGNSVAVPCAEFVMGGIASQLRKKQQLM